MEVINLILEANKEIVLAVKRLQSLPSTPISSKQDGQGGHPLSLEGTPEDYIKALKELQFGKYLDTINRYDNYDVMFCVAINRYIYNN